MQQNNSENMNTSPTSSRNSSSDSLNYLTRKDSLSESQSQRIHLNQETLDYSLNNLNLSKKKSLKTTLYKIFTQRKKSNTHFNLNDKNYIIIY